MSKQFFLCQYFFPFVLRPSVSGPIHSCCVGLSSIFLFQLANVLGQIAGHCLEDLEWQIVFFFYFLLSELLADNHFYLLMTASQIDYLFFYFGVFGMDSVSFLSTESVAGRITASTSFVRPNILSLLFKLLFDKVRKLTCLISGSTGKLTNILSAIM